MKNAQYKIELELVSQWIDYDPEEIKKRICSLIDVLDEKEQVNHENKIHLRNYQNFKVYKIEECK